MPDTNLNIWIKIRNQTKTDLQSANNNVKNFVNNVKKNYAALIGVAVAAAFAIKKAFDFAELGAKAAQIESSFHKMTVAVGGDFQELKKQIIEASRETVNFSNVASQATVLLGRGVTQSQIIELMKVARVEAQKTGMSVEESFNQIGGAIAGGFLVTVKRNYGLAVDLASAYEEYSKQTGMSVDQVRKSAAAQALANQVIKAASLDLTAFNSETRTSLEHLQSLQAWWTGFKETLGQIIISVIQMMAVMVKTLQAGFAGAIEGLSNLLAIALTGIQKTLEGINKIAKSEAIKGMITNLEASSKFMKDFAESEKSVGTEFAAAALEISSYLGNSEKITEEQKKAMQDMASNLSSNTNEVKVNAKIMEDLATQTAKNIQGAFEESFFDAFTGQLGSAQEIFASFGESILRTISSIMAQIVTYYAVIGPLTKIFPELSTILKFGSYQLGTSYVPQTGLYQLHKGEQVVPESKQGGGGGAQTVNYFIHAADSKSFSQMLNENSASIHQIVQENINRRGTLSQTIRTR